MYNAFYCFLLFLLLNKMYCACRCSSKVQFVRQLIVVGILGCWPTQTADPKHSMTTQNPIFLTRLRLLQQRPFSMSPLLFTVNKTMSTHLLTHWTIKLHYQKNLLSMLFRLGHCVALIFQSSQFQFMKDRM